MPKKHKPVAAKLTPDLLKRMAAIAEELCPGVAYAEDRDRDRPKDLDDPFPSLNYWFPPNLPHGQPCYAVGSSNRTDLPHQIGFASSPTGALNPVADVYFSSGSSGTAYLTAPNAAGSYYLCIEAYNGTAWVNRYSVAVAVS